MNCFRRSMPEPRASGRDPSNLQRMIWIPVSYHPDRARALAASRLEAGVLVPGVVDSVLDPREMERLGESVDEQLITESSCVATSAGEIVDCFGRYLEAGANHIIWGDLSPDGDIIPEIAERGTCGAPPPLGSGFLGHERPQNVLRHP